MSSVRQARSAATSAQKLAEPSAAARRQAVHARPRTGSRERRRLTTTSPFSTDNSATRIEAEKHLAFYRKYKPDDNARDRAIVIHRSANPAANHAAEAIVIYDLRRDGAHELGAGDQRRAAAFELIVPSAQGDFTRLAGDGVGTPTEAGG